MGKRLQKTPKKNEDGNDTKPLSLLNYFGTLLLQERISPAGKTNIVVDLLLAGAMFLSMAPDILNGIYQTVALWLNRSPVAHEAGANKYFFAFLFFSIACIAFMHFTLSEEKAKKDRDAE